MKNKVLFLPLLLIALVFSSCGSSKEEQKTESTIDQTKVPKELTDMTGVTTYYECPMKCEDKKFAGSGICPICGMDLVLVEVKSDSTTTAPDTTKQM